MSEPIPSATVVLLRDTPSGMKVLLLRRNSDIAYGGSWVFPGGRIDPHEFQAAGDDQLQAARLAAVRETAEEANVRITEKDLHYFAHWTTPVVRPKRFSTWFFLATVNDKAVQIDGGEIHDFEWHTPEKALAAQGEGRIELPPPTYITLIKLLPFRQVEAALQHFRAIPPLELQPVVLKTPEGLVYLYNGDAGFATSDPLLPGIRHRLLQPKTGPWQYLCEC